MSDPDTNTKKVKVYVRLIGEGTEVSRPTEAADLGNGLFQILAASNYNPDDETWEFPPGTIVRCETHRDETGEFRLVVKARET